MSFDIILRENTGQNFDINFGTNAYTVVEGIPKQVADTYVLVDGTWRLVTEAYISVNGTWEQSTGMDI